MTEQRETHGQRAQRVARAVDAAPGPGAESRDIPQATVARLAAYLRVLETLADGEASIVSSEELASACGVGSAKLRKDLSFLGPNGVRGVGYDVHRLRKRIERALGLERGHRVVIVGIGNLGRALARYGGFGRRGFSVVGLFDSDPALVGETVAGFEVRDAASLPVSCAELGATIGVVATPDDAAQRVADSLVDSGMRCIMSFAQVALVVPPHVELREVDLAAEMQVLSFNSARNTQQADGAPAAGHVDGSCVRVGSAVPTPAPRNGSVIAP